MKNILSSQTGFFGLAFSSLVLLSACSAAVSARQVAAPAQVPSIGDPPAELTTGPSQLEGALPETGWVLDVPRNDEQGAVSVEITPLNLNMPGETLDFSVVLNTHSVDLSMDLASLASLTTDTGLDLSASAWEAPLGGHHVQGVLKFPAVQDGVGVMDGVMRLTLVIRGLDAPERAFVWEK